jgi:hypothetical protein
VIGINSTLTESGSNDNLRILDWTSSGYTPSSLISAAESVADLIKEQVSDDAPGENRRDVDVQEITNVAKASSVPVHDLDQYIVSCLSKTR